MALSSWKLEQVARDKAMRKGEDIATAYGFDAPPIDPFKIIDAERELIHAEGGDFGAYFDGRLSYVGPRFFLCYNTRYNAWPHRGAHHPKIRFTVGHELGHFFLDEHRKYLVANRKPHGSKTEFESQQQVERQADSFSAGLLMPEYVLRPRINDEAEPSLESIRSAARDFDVSMTAMMVRWTQLSHFPCATICVRDRTIQWGFVSEGFRSAHLYRARRGAALVGKAANAFLELEPGLGEYREGEGLGLAKSWLDWDGDRIPVTEYYMAIPYSRCLLVFVAADEEDLPGRWDND